MPLPYRPSSSLVAVPAPEPAPSRIGPVLAPPNASAMKTLTGCLFCTIMLVHYAPVLALRNAISQIIHLESSIVFHFHIYVDSLFVRHRSITV